MSDLAENMRRQTWQRQLAAAAEKVEFWARMLDLPEGRSELYVAYERAFNEAYAAYERLQLEYSVALPGGTDDDTGT